MERSKTPSSTSTTERVKACQAIWPPVWPRRERVTREKGKAAPARKENDGWMRSCREQPMHSTWVWWWARICQKTLLPLAAATLPNWSASAISRNITNPRKASSEANRAAGAAWLLSALGVTASARVKGAILPSPIIQWRFVAPVFRPRFKRKKRLRRLGRRAVKLLLRRFEAHPRNSILSKFQNSRQGTQVAIFDERI